MKFIATIQKVHRDKIDEIADSLRQMGVRVDKVLKLTGIITGNSASNNLQDIKIKGVASVEKEKRVRVS